MGGMTTSSRIGEHLRSNVVGYIALFCFAMAGTAGALPGKNKVDSGDIKQGNVRLGDLGANSVDSSKVVDDALTGADVNEASLSLPPSPTTLPPSGPAGGDLSGQYPNPQVSEAELAAGGDLSGSLAAAQIGSGAVGDAEIADTDRSIVIGASEVGFNVTGGAGEPDLGEFPSPTGFPAVLFGDTTKETLDLVTVVPDDIAGPHRIDVRAYFSSAASGTIRLEMGIGTVTPATSETLSGFSALFVGSFGLPLVGDQLSVAPFFGANVPNVLPGDLVRIQIARDPTVMSDTLVGDAALLAVELEFSTDR